MPENVLPDDFLHGIKYNDYSSVRSHTDFSCVVKLLGKRISANILLGWFALTGSYE